MLFRSQGEFVADLVVDDRAGIQKESGKTLIDDAVIDARSQTKAGAETVPESEASPSVPSMPARKPIRTARTISMLTTIRLKHCLNARVAIGN